MKKWMNYVVIMGLTAGTASAAWWPFGSDEKEEAAPAVAPASEPVKEHQRTQMTPEQMEKMKARREAGGQGHPRMSPEQMEKMKAMHEELKKIGEAARNETDPAKKEVLVGQLRAKLSEVADKMQAEGQKRMEKAETELTKLKEKLAEAEQKKSARIEQQVQRILAGEPMRGPDGKRPEGASKKEGKKRPAAPIVE